MGHARRSASGDRVTLPPVRILVATPVPGTVEAGTVASSHMISALKLMRTNGVEWILHSTLTHMDLVRARSRAVCMALDGCYTHLLFWDSDVSGDAITCLQGMLASGADVVAAPYARKRLPIRGSHNRPFVAMGFTLISIKCLEKMWDAYYDELHFDDVIENKPYRSVALFQLMLVELEQPRPHRVLLGEDYSFCERWLRIGGEIHVYTGSGAPLDHVGMFKFSGTIEEMAP